MKSVWKFLFVVLVVLFLSSCTSDNRKIAGCSAETTVDLVKKMALKDIERMATLAMIFSPSANEKQVIVRVYQYLKEKGTDAIVLKGISTVSANDKLGSYQCYASVYVKGPKGDTMKIGFLNYRSTLSDDRKFVTVDIDDPSTLFTGGN